MGKYKVYITTTNGRYLYYMNTVVEITDRLNGIENHPDIWGQLNKVIITVQAVAK